MSRSTQSFLSLWHKGRASTSPSLPPSLPPSFPPSPTFMYLNMRLERLDRLVQLPLSPRQALIILLDEAMLQQLSRRGSIRQIPQALREKVLKRRRETFQSFSAKDAKGLGRGTAGLLIMHG